MGREAEDFLKKSQSNGHAIDAIAEEPTATTMLRLIGDTDVATTAVIAVDGPGAATTGAGLAARYPDMPVYTPDRNTDIADDSIRVAGLPRS